MFLLRNLLLIKVSHKLKRTYKISNKEYSRKMVESNKAGVGSIWNKGNWHWEEKNYTEFAKEWLTNQFCSIVMDIADA